MAGLHFSPDSKHLGYRARKGLEHYLILDGQTLGPFGDVSPDSPAFSADSKFLLTETPDPGGKGVTVINGLPLTGTALEDFATRLKKICGAGGAVKDGNIEIQGEHRDRLVTELGKLGYDAKRSGG